MHTSCYAPRMNEEFYPVPRSGSTGIQERAGRRARRGLFRPSLGKRRLNSGASPRRLVLLVLRLRSSRWRRRLMNVLKLFRILQGIFEGVPQDSRVSLEDFPGTERVHSAPP